MEVFYTFQGETKCVKVGEHEDVKDVIFDCIKIDKKYLSLNTDQISGGCEIYVDLDRDKYYRDIFDYMEDEEINNPKEWNNFSENEWNAIYDNLEELWIQDFEDKDFTMDLSIFEKCIKLTKIKIDYCHIKELKGLDKIQNLKYICLIDSVFCNLLDFSEIESLEKLKLTFMKELNFKNLPKNTDILYYRNSDKEILYKVNKLNTLNVTNVQSYTNLDFSMLHNVENIIFDLKHVYNIDKSKVKIPDHNPKVIYKNEILPEKDYTPFVKKR